jgi:hypothetical protein
VRGRRRWTVAPEVVNEALDRHYLPRAEQQGGQDGLLLTTSQLECTSSDRGFERAEDEEADVL